MFAIRVELLGGIYRASSFDDRRKPEWPPHPARLFFAAVAAMHDDGPPDPAERDALLWWEAEGAPLIHLSEKAWSSGLGRWRSRRVLDHYVPGNFATSWTRDFQNQWIDLRELESELMDARAAGDDTRVGKAEKALTRATEKLVDATRKNTASSASESSSQVASVVQLLPEHRDKQARQFPAVVPDDPVFYFSWPDATVGPHRQPLDDVLARIARLGHSASTVSCAVVDDVPHAVSLAPSDNGDYSLRTAAGGVLDELERDFVRHQGNSSRVMPALLTSYAVAGRSRTTSVRATIDEEWIVLGLPRGEKLPASRALDLTVAVRSALLSHAAEPISSFISGHEPGPAPTPPTTAPHIAILPLIDASHRYSDGTIHGVAISLPPAAAEEKSALLETLARWQAYGDSTLPVTLRGGVLRRFNAPRISATSTSTRDVTVLDRPFWSGASVEWASVTPVALERHPKARPGTERYAAQTTELVTRACDRLGLPAPVSVTCSTIPYWAAAPAVALASGRRGQSTSGFPQFRSSAGAPRHTVHVRVQFAQPVAGPLTIGAGRFFGYGLLLPIRNAKGASTWAS